MDPNRITYFAETDARNKKVKFGIKAKDRLRHFYVIGKTGLGKSTLLENMAIQDIQNGEGIAFIDPHGGTAEKLLEYVPEHRIKDVLYFAPFDLEYPVSFNVMEDIGADKRHLVVNGLMSTFEKIWVDAWSARMAYILNNTLLALLEYPGATLLGVNRMLSDKAYRSKIVENVKDPSVKAFWIEEFGKYTEKFAAEATPAIQNKVGQFTSNPLVRNLIGQSESTFNIRDFMDKRKIIIINLSKGRVGEGNANLIGSMLITKIYLAAMSRADASEQELAKLPNFYLYVDEFQSFANKSFADILSEARKYKLNLTIAHQYIEQMEEEVRDAVFGNVGTMVTFRVGAFDAEMLEKEFFPTFTAEDLVNLGFAQVYLKLMIDGVSSAPFSATTLGPIAKPEISFKDQVIESSRKQFACPRAEVEEKILAWHKEGSTADARPAQNGGGNGGSGYGGDRGERRDRSPAGSAPNGLREVLPQILQKKEEVPPKKAEEPKVDQNKMAFMNAAELLRKKESETRPVPASVPEQPPVDTSAQTKPTPVQAPAPTPTISLSALKNSNDKKTPTKENLSSLKDILSKVSQKSNTPPVPPAPRPVVKELEKIEKKEEDKKPEQRRESESVSPQESSKKEVPEDVLRKILSMDDK